jgi:hypothetical protein
MITDSIAIIMVLTVIVEVLTNGVKSIFPVLKGNSSRFIAAAIGILICVYTNIGIFSRMEISIEYKLIDYIITGIIISRGSNAVHDIISVFNKKNSELI